MAVERSLRTLVASDAAIPAMIGSGPAMRYTPIKLPPQATLPALVYQRISGVQDQTHDNPKGGLKQARFSFTAWGESFSDARALALAVQRALTVHHMVVDGVRIERISNAGEMDRQDDTTQRFMSIVDFMVVYEES